MESGTRDLDGRWRLLETGARPGAWNMACDRAVLDAVGRGAAPPTVRFYGWDPPAVSLGRHQPDPDPDAAAVLAARGVTWVRRPTGGRAVYHGPPAEELTYAVIAPLSVPPLDGSLADAYRGIHEALAEGVRTLGAEASLAPRRPGRAPRPTDRRACFAASVPWEIQVDGRKLLGSAQRRSRLALLQHGSLPLAGDQAPLRAAWPDSLGPAASTTLSEAVGRRVEFAEAAAALAAALACGLGIELAPGGLTADERARVATAAGSPLA